MNMNAVSPENICQLSLSIFACNRLRGTSYLSDEVNVNTVELMVNTTQLHLQIIDHYLQLISDESLQVNKLTNKLSIKCVATIHSCTCR